MYRRKFRRVSCLVLIFVLVGFVLVFPISAYAFGPSIDLSYADASFIGEGEGAFSGNSVASAGDVNGDGYDDFLIGAFGDDEGGTDFGQTYLILGKATADWGNDFDLTNADASFIGEAYGWSGYSVASAGDVNGDGYDDFLIGVPMLMDPFFFSWAGKTYLILGKATADWGNDFNLANADASFISEGWGWSGWSVASAGNVNGDDFDDFLIGAPVNDEGGDAAGQTYLILGEAAAGWGKDVSLGNADASFIGERDDAYSGRSVASAGDVDDDGYDDFLIGAPYDAEGGTDTGQSYLILGKETGWAMDTNLSAADASFIGERNGALSGWSVASAGDVNGDGYDDFLVGAYGDEEGETDAGQTYLILGKETGWAMDTNLSDANASFIGEHADDWSGNSVASAGDVNGDGYDDFLIGAFGDDDAEVDAGQTYFILGEASADWGNDFDLGNADAFFIGEDEEDLSGASVACAGDVNGDGYDDFLISAYGDEEGGSSAGQTYLILGEAPPAPAVGGEAYSINRANVLAPWLGLALIMVIAVSILVKRRRQANKA